MAKKIVYCNFRTLISIISKLKLMNALSFLFFYGKIYVNRRFVFMKRDVKNNIEKWGVLMKKIILLLMFSILLLSCSSGVDDEEVIETVTLSKDHLPRQMTNSGTIHNQRVYIPYPSFENVGEKGVPYIIGEISNNNLNYVNDTPSNLCNKGDVTQCSTFNTGWIESLIVTDDYIITVEDAFGALKFETYLTIQNLDGSNRKEIVELKANPNPLFDFQIQSDNENIYFILKDELHRYSIKEDKLDNLTEDLEMRYLSNLKLEDNDKLYFSVNTFEKDGVKYSNAIIEYDGDFNVKQSNIEKEIFRVYKDKYFVKVVTDITEAYINYYTDEDIPIPLENQGFMYVLSVDDKVVTYDTTLNDGFQHYIRLYEDTGSGLKQLDVYEFVDHEMYFLHAIEGNMILFSKNTDSSTGAMFIEPITIEIVDNKLANIKYHPYQADK